jgi:hypothetical protein
VALSFVGGGLVAGRSAPTGGQRTARLGGLTEAHHGLVAALLGGDGLVGHADVPEAEAQEDFRATGGTQTALLGLSDEGGGEVTLEGCSDGIGFAVGIQCLDQVGGERDQCRSAANPAWGSSSCRSWCIS